MPKKIPMNTAATVYGSYPRPVQATGTAPVASATAVAPIFESFAPADHAAALSAAEAGPVASAMGAWLTRIRLAFDRWRESKAQTRADDRVWDIARSDPRVMADLMHARMRDDSDADNQPAMAPVAAPALQEEAPVRQQPRNRVASQGWGRMIEDAYQSRFHQPRPKHA
jgi:hypothetical protein